MGYWIKKWSSQIAHGHFRPAYIKNQKKKKCYDKQMLLSSLIYYLSIIQLLTISKRRKSILYNFFPNYNYFKCVSSYCNCTCKQIMYSYVAVTNLQNLFVQMNSPVNFYLFTSGF